MELNTHLELDGSLNPNYAIGNPKIIKSYKLN